MSQSRLDTFFKVVGVKHATGTQNIKRKKNQKQQKNKRISVNRHNAVEVCQIIYEERKEDGEKTLTQELSFDSSQIDTTQREFDNNTKFRNIVSQAIEQLNLTKQGIIQSNNFNLEEIYSSSTFNYKYTSISGTTSVNYRVSDIEVCNDLSARTLFSAIFNVLSNPVNCGYFEESEIDFIYSIITLPKNAQKLLARMIKRKKGWFRKANINYPEIENIEHVFKILVSKGICMFDNDISQGEFPEVLELLQVNEIRALCKKFKIKCHGNKGSNIKELLKILKQKPLFFGMEHSPSSSLRKAVFNILDYCVCIAPKTWCIINRIITLLIPNHDPSSNLANIFYTLVEIDLENIAFPDNPGHYYPVFPSKVHLLNYISARSFLFSTLQYIEKKNWTKVQENGKLAMDILQNMLIIESLKLENSMLPKHVRKYMPGYTWLKILDKSIESFKKEKDKKRVVEVLQFLLKQNCHMDSRKGKWYKELALIKMHHLKDMESSACTIIEALNKENVCLTKVDIVDLIERANTILKRKNVTITQDTKVNIDKVLNNNVISNYQPSSITIHGTMSRVPTKNKSMWLIETSTESNSYDTVETLALCHYQKLGFNQGLHCEGSLPIILFATLFWEELYEVNIPGAFATQYEEAPSDLFTDQFYENRKEKINTKFDVTEKSDPLSFSRLMELKFKKYSKYKSIMSSNLLNSSQLKEIVHCIGVKGVLGICKKLIENFRLWRAGFPDLIVWNYDHKMHKIVEVKGPRDVLSTKQKLWLEYLHQLGLNTQVCLVKDQKRQSIEHEQNTQDVTDYIDLD